MEGMRRVTVVVTLFSILAIETTAQSNLKSLYDSRKWAELYVATRKAKGNGLYRCAVAVVFNRRRDAEVAFRSMIKSAPRSQETFEAYEWMIHLYLRAGQYRQLTSVVDERSAA